MNSELTIFGRVLSVGLPFLIVAAIVGGVFYAIRPPAPSEYATPAYRNSQMVEMRAFGHKGMIVRSSCWLKKYRNKCTYSIRFSAMQLRTNVSLFGKDGPVDFAPVALVSGIREFELKAIY